MEENNMKYIDRLADLIFGFFEATGRLLSIILMLIGASIVIGIFGAEGMKVLITIAVIIVVWKLVNRIFKEGS